MPVLCVLGARNLGGALVDDALAAGWPAAALARSDATLERVRRRGALGVRADAADPAQLDAALRHVRDELGGLDLLVNAVRADRPREGRPEGGGALLEAELEDHRAWATAICEQGFVFLSRGARALRAAGGGTLVQVTGGSALGAAPGRGPWGAGAAGLRALVEAGAQELAPHGVHVALLVVVGTIASAETEGEDPATLVDPAEVARAARFLHEQGPRGRTRELVVRA